MSNKKIITGFCIGFIAGILFAPDKGSATRKKITRRFDDLCDDMQRFTDETIGKLSAIGKDVVEDVEEKSKDIFKST